MKSAVFALLLVVAGAFAFPQSNNPRPSLEDRIKNRIEQLSERIRNGGYDPWTVESAKYEAIIASEVIEIGAYFDDIEITGASCIDLNHVEFIPFINKLTVDVSLPELKMTIGRADVDVIFFQSTLETQLSGSLTVSGIRLASEMTFNIDLIEGVSVRSITVDFFAGIVQSNLNLHVNGKNLSEGLNNLVGVTIPVAMDDHRNEINRGLEAIIRTLIDNLYD